METWVLLSVAAAFVQALRFAVQKSLAQGDVSPAAATWARFVWSAPLVLLLTLVAATVRDVPIPRPGPAFWAYALPGGIAQILATISTVALFRRRAFAIGITFKKTEVLLTALAGAVVLGDAVPPAGWLAIAAGFLGVVLLSEPPEGGSRFNRGAALGLLSGLFFALSAVFYRGATLALDTGDTLVTAGLTLAAVTLWQTLALGLWLALREPGQGRAILVRWRATLPVGLLSLLGSWCWFAAFSLERAAYVFAVGQVELIFSLALGAAWFGERLTRREGAGLALLALSILAVALLG